MKKIIKSLALVAVAAMGLTACQNEYNDEHIEANDSVVVTFVADEADATRTTVDTSGEDAPVFAWDKSEPFAVLEQTDALAEAGSSDGTVTFVNEEGKAKITAEFEANAYEGEYKYVTIYPESGYYYSQTKSINDVVLYLPELQYIYNPASYDPNADLMVSEVVTTTAQPTEAQMVRFTRLAAIAKMTLKNFELEAGDKIESVIFTAEGKDLAGTISADLADPHAFTVEEGVDSVTITVSDPEVDSLGNVVVYFTTLPTTLEAGDTYTITILTSKKFFVKEGTIPAEKSLNFTAGDVTRFGVNMADVEGYDRWELVKDASTLKEGDVVAIVAKDYDKALSTNLYSGASETSTSARRDAVAISKLNNFLVANETVQQFTLVAGSVEGTFSFYDKARNAFLVSNNKTSRYLINQAYISNDTSFAITTDAETGDANIKNTEGDYKDCMIRYYNSSKYFYSGTSANQAVCIYRLAGVEGSVPVVAANITVPDESVVISEDATTEATAISTELVKFNYVGPWTISVSDNAEWLTVAYDATQNALTYTAEANAGAKREAVVTITASLEGEESLTWNFNVVQKGVPQEVTIADFITKGQDVNITYKITGVVTEATTSSDGTYKLSDGNGNIATVTYLYTDGGNKVKDDATIGLKVGDVVTVTTVVTGTTKGKGGSGDYHSIYKGHYRLATSVGVAANFTSGSSVEITVTTSSNGSITVPEAVEATIAANDYATLDYSGNTATVTFNSENTTSDAREAEVTFTYGLASATVVAQQGINPANKKGYELVTDASKLAVGDEVIIVAKNAEKAIGCPTSTSATSFPAVAISKTGNVIYDVEAAGVQVFTLGNGVSEGTMSFDFTYKDTGYRLYYSSGLKMRATSNAVNAATSWSIEINAGDGDATITSTRLIKFNSTGGSTFTVYATTNANATKTANAVCIYKKQK